MKKPITLSIRTARDYKGVLEESMEDVFKPSFFSGATIKDKIEYIKVLAEARAIMWHTVLKEFPEVGGKSVQISNDFIEWEEEEELNNK